MNIFIKMTYLMLKCIKSDYFDDFDDFEDKPYRFKQVEKKLNNSCIS